MTTREVVVSFMAHCRLRGLSGRTLEGYNLHTKRLIELSPEFPPKPDAVQQFLAELTPHNADAHYRTFKALARWAHKRYRTKNFMLSVTRPRVPREIMPTISGTELNLLAWKLKEASPRDKAILALFIDTGLRRGEAVNLQRKDIHEDRVICHGKTGYRQVPISDVTRDLLLSLPSSDGYVFHGCRGERLQSTGFYKVIRRYLRTVGYTGRQCGPQVLRRSLGRFWLLDGGDMKSLSQLLGHKSILTTDKYYTPLMIEDVVRIHKKHTPGRVFIDG